MTSNRCQLDGLTSIILYIEAVRKHCSRTFFKNLWSFQITLCKKNPTTFRQALQKHRRSLQSRLDKLSRLLSRTSGYLSLTNPPPNEILKSQPLYLVVLDIDLDWDVHEFETIGPPFTKSPDTYEKDWEKTIVKLGTKYTTKSLIVNECRIDTGIVGSMARCLGGTLQELWLGNNIIGDDGAELIAKKMRRLFLLSLAINRITDTGAVAIARWATPKLRILKLQQNLIGEYGYTAIISQLTHLKRLQIGQSTRHSNTLQASLKQLASFECIVRA